MGIVMIVRLSDPDYWRARAVEARKLVDKTNDAEIRVLMAKVALGYEVLAHYAELYKPPKGA